MTGLEWVGQILAARRNGTPDRFRAVVAAPHALFPLADAVR